MHDDIRPAGAIALQAVQVHGQVRGRGRRLLGPLDAQFQPGRVTAVLGPNGAGKSTLLSVLTGWRRPDVGSVHWQGRPLQQISPAALARQRALVAQDTAVAADFRVHELVALGLLPARPADPEACVRQAIAACGLAGLADRSVATLSGGERARAQLARALVQIEALSPPVAGAPARWLLLDEPTAALDLQHQHALLQLVRQCALAGGIGVVVVLHDLNLALRHADDALVLQQGRARALGPVRQVLQPALVQDVWQVQGRVMQADDDVPQYLWQPPAAGPLTSPWHAGAAGGPASRPPA